MSIYRWAVTGIALVVFKFAVDNALSVRTAFARIKYVCSACTIACPKPKVDVCAEIVQAADCCGLTRSASWLLR